MATNEVTSVSPSVTKPKQRFTLYNKIINPLAPFAIPLLASIAPVFAPIYRRRDGNATTASDEESRKPSNSYKPVVVVASRTVKDIAAYKTEFQAYASAAQSNGSGVRACFSFVDHDKENTVLSFAWFDSCDDYVVQPPSLVDMYSGSTNTDYCVIFGGWNELMKESVSKMGGCDYAFSKDPHGYLKESIAEHARDFNTGEQVMIWLSKRKIKEGRIANMQASFQKGTDLMYKNAPAALGIMEFKSETEPDTVWSLRVFNEFDRGFKRHFPVPSFIMFRMIFNVVPCWESYPIGISFSTADDIAGAITSNPGNKAYTQYHFETGVIGPKPDFGKGY